MVAFATGFRVRRPDDRETPAVEALFFDDVEFAGRADVLEALLFDDTVFDDTVSTSEVRPRSLRRARHARSPKPRFAVLILLILGISAIFSAVSSPQSTALNWYLSIVWSSYFPLAIVGITGALFLRTRHRTLLSRDRLRADLGRHRDRERGSLRFVRDSSFAPRSFFTGRTDKMLVVVVPSLVCAANLPALQRVVGSLLRYLPDHFSRFRIDVIAEDGNDVAPLIFWLHGLGAARAHVRVHVVPSSYSTPRGAKFKTRANHYAMEARALFHENTSDVFVYHLDDDTSIGEDTSASLAEFIENDSEHFLAQGVLAFPRELTASRFCWLADAVRPADDLTRFAFFTGMLGSPLGGLHGEHLIVRADIEDEIGWDYPDTVIEDAYFGMEFANRYPGRATTLNSYSYGASPSSVRDLVRQRRRWIEGLLRLIFNPTLRFRTKIPLSYSVFTWALAPFQFVGLVLLLSYVTGINNTSPVSPWLIPVWSISLAWVFWLYFEGLKVNLAASRRSEGFVLNAILLVPFIYVASTVETCGIVLGIVRFLGFGRQRESEVIAKPL